MVSGFTTGVMVASTRVTGIKTRLVVLASIYGLIKDGTRVNGSIIIWKGQAFITGQMVGAIKDSIWAIKSMDLEYIPGQMAASTKGTGSKGGNMGWVLI